jgi:hypothetical protein
VPGLGPPIGGPLVGEDVGDLQGRSCHDLGGRHRQLF